MVIGLVGRSCAGKDEAAKRLMERGIPCIDVDRLGHEALKANVDILAETFGDGILASDGTVDRKKLGPIVFSDPAKLEKLNSISHPWMREHVVAFVKENETCMINCALLESMRLVPLCDEILFFYAPLEVRIERAMTRDSLTREAFLKREESQKEIGSTLFDSGVRVLTILNGGDKNNLYRQLDFYYDTLLARGYVYGKVISDSIT